MTRSAASAAAAGARRSSSASQPAATKRPGLAVSPTTGRRSGAETSRPAPASTSAQPEDAGTRRWTSERSVATAPALGQVAPGPGSGLPRARIEPSRRGTRETPRDRRSRVGPVGVGRRVQPQPRPHGDGEPEARGTAHPARASPAREDDGLGRQEPARRFDAGDPPGREGHRLSGAPLVDPHARGACRQHEGTAHAAGPRHSVAGKGERGLERSRKSGFAPPRLVGLEDLEVDPPGPLRVEGPVQEDFFGVVEGHRHRAAFVVLAGKPRLLLERREPVGEEVPGEKREVGQRLGHGLHRRLGRHRPPGRRRDAGPASAGQEVDRQVAPGQLQGESRRGEAAPGDDDVRRRKTARHATLPSASRTGPLPGISGGPHLRSTRATTARPTACTAP